MLGTLVSPIIARLIRIVLVVAAIVGGGFYLHHSGYNEGYRVAEDKGKIELAEYKETQRKKLDELVAANRKTEEDLQTKLLQSQSEKELEIQAINDTHQRLVHSLRNRAPRKPTPTPDPSPTPSTTECPRAGSNGSELSREDGEFLVGEAAAADTLRQALRLCREAYNRILEGAYKKP
jgi:hypothetical protein